ncbi:segmentation protein even-skipped-like [Amphibalanus amphitrite]|uniref:segmentation protein even-skipped-like n=1 Tax=Amphibalanus amphitrite TaxID=1232801 RepID=UPI001C92252D|nr:segmentation protein even-skipped-like [Amphibalanus amphitrite]XP_043243732.1 segmentation protein even-skipped-like [Amphibalanus amphitrite]
MSGHTVTPGALVTFIASHRTSEVTRSPERPLEVSADSSSCPTDLSDTSLGREMAMSCDSTDQLSEERPQHRSTPPPPSGTKLTSGDLSTGGTPDPGIRRYRTAFRPDQIKRLEAEFLKDNYVSRPKRNELATELGLAEGTIKVWFQNRRMKHKRQQMTAWPLDPRFADPTLAALLLQAAVASGGYGPYGAAPPPPPHHHHPTHHGHPGGPPAAVLPHLAGYYGPLAAAKGRFSPYPALPLRPQPSLASGFLLPPPPQPPLLGSAGRGSLSPPLVASSAAAGAVTSSSPEHSTFFRPFETSVHKDGFESGE